MSKRKLTAAEKAAKKHRREAFMTIFLNGKQKRVKRPQLIEGLPLDEFVRRNADPIFLQQNETWEHMALPVEGDDRSKPAAPWLDEEGADCADELLFPAP